ncbi:restriction endonuclease subunit S [Bacillus zhangzhouensis]|uniref:restriction endonuclease subunit S n=1 Tax=Bacillus zhangzhouensis TaxID=1178540 RepID=UPI0020BDC689
MKQGYLEYKESGYEWLGEIPLHWELKKAKWSFKEKSIKGYPDELLLSVSKGKGVIPRGELENKAVMAFKDLQNFKLVLPEDFVIHLRSFQSGFEMSMNKGIVSPAYTVFSCKKGLLPSYYKFLFYMQNFIDAIASTTQSLRDGKPIAYRDFSNMVLPFPKYNEQVKIANFLKVKLKEVDNLIYTKKKLIFLLEQQRQSIITEAVTKGLNPNVKMKHSGVEWIGEIPEHWKVKKIKHFATHVGSGKTPSGGSEVYLDEGVPFLRSLNVHFDGIRLKDLAFISEDTNAEMKSSQVQPLDILLNITGASIGRTAIVPKDFGRANVNQHVCIIRLNKKKMYPYYFNMLMASDVINQQIWFAQNGSSREGLNFVQVKELKFAMPPTIEEQREINDWVFNKQKTIYDVMSKIKEQIEKLKEYRQSLIYEAVTGKIDVRDMELGEVR